MKRYLNSFLISSFIYVSIFASLFFVMDDVKKVNIKNEKTIALNHISLVQQKKITKKVEKPKPKKKNPPKKVVKKVVKKPVQKIKEVKTLKSKIKKIVKAKEKIVKKEIVEKEEEKIEQVQLKKTVIKRDYKKEFINNHLKKIIALIQKNMQYPKRAKQFNIQGEVLIEFTLTKEGITKNFKAIKGHKLLKKSTINAIKKASKYFPKVQKRLELIVPVAYNLT